jgi:hypothetical protein
MSKTGDSSFTFQISPRTKGPPLTCDNPYTERGLIIEPFPDCVELGVACGVDAVEVFRAGERDEEDVRSREGEFGVLGLRGWDFERHVSVFCFRDL